METIVANAVGKARLVTLDGVDYLVSPSTLIVPGVLNGSKGRLYYPPSEVGKNPSMWDDVDIVVYHPTRNGHSISAKNPGVLGESGIGKVRKSVFNGKLQSELWFDVKRTHAYDQRLPEQSRILPRIRNGQPVELSTGLFTDNIAVEAGTVAPNGAQYDYIAHNYRPDHLAVLPDQVGACSINDGCGVLINQAAVSDMACVLNTEQVCINCGGKGGKRGKCPKSAGGMFHKALADAHGKAAEHDEHAASALARMQATESKLHDYGGHGQDLGAGLKSSRYGTTAKGKIQELLKEHEGHFAEFQKHTALRDQHKAKAAKIQEQSTRNKAADTGCTLNAEGICANCGGKGGKKGACAGTKGARLSGKAEQASKNAFQTGDKAQHLDAANKHAKASMYHAGKGNEAEADRHDVLSRQHLAASKHVPKMATNTEPVMPMTREQKINQLVANCTCKDKAVTDRAALNAVSDEFLDSLMATNAKAEGSNADVTGGGFKQAGGKGTVDEYTEDEKKKVLTGNAATITPVTPQKATMTELLRNASPEEQEVWNSALAVNKQAKLSIVRKLVANIDDKDRRVQVGNALMGKQLSELQTLEMLIPTGNQNGQPKPPQPTYIGAAGGYNELVVDNRAGLDDLLPEPTMNWAEEHKLLREQKA